MLQALESCGTHYGMRDKSIRIGRPRGHKKLSNQTKVSQKQMFFPPVASLSYETKDHGTAHHRMPVHPGRLKSLIGVTMLLPFLWMQAQNTHKPPGGWSPSSAISIPNHGISPTSYQTPSARKARLAEPELQPCRLCDFGCITSSLLMAARPQCG
jgi:hypothetical protein